MHFSFPSQPALLLRSGDKNGIVWSGELKWDEMEAAAKGCDTGTAFDDGIAFGRKLTCTGTNVYLLPGVSQTSIQARYRTLLRVV
jgi:hypothetical protein